MTWESRSYSERVLVGLGSWPASRRYYRALRVSYGKELS